MPIDHTKQFTAAATMDAETIRAYRKAVPDSVARDIVRDHLGKPTSLPGVHGESSGKPGGNWIEPTPVRPPDGVAIMDRIADHFAAMDKRELKQRMGVRDEPPAGGENGEVRRVLGTPRQDCG